MFPEKDEMGSGKDNEQYRLVSTPGLTLLQTIGAGPIRGLYYTSTGVLFAVSGSNVYLLNSAFQATLIGTLLTSSGQVGMADNGIQLVIVDGPNGYYTTLATPSSVTQIVNSSWLGSQTVTFIDGYFVFVVPNSNEFYLSDLNAVTFNNPALTAKNGLPDNIVVAINLNRNVWLLGSQTSEIWYDAGNALNPLQYIQGTLMQYGCCAVYSTAVVGNTLFWLGQDRNGAGIVYMANGYAPQRVSNHAVEQAIQGYSSFTDAVAWSYQENGHQFYVLNFPTGNATWVFDIATNMWHERAYLSSGSYTRILSGTYAFAYGLHLTGDYTNGNIYLQSSIVYSDNGNAIKRTRISPHISDNMVRISFKSFQLDMEPGQGLDGSSQGSNPLAMLSWSDDGGNSYSDEMTASLGKDGVTQARCLFRRLGYSRNRVFKVSISDPVPVKINGATLELEEHES
jgi:hypothetical protein